MRLWRAIDGQARTWEVDGLWLAPATAGFYSWTPPVRTLSRLVVLLAVLLLLPLLVVVATALVVYPLGFVLDTFAPGMGTAIVSGYQGVLERAFAPGMVPAIVPRLGVIVIVAAAGALLTVAARARWRNASADQRGSALVERAGCAGGRLDDSRRR